MPCGKLPLVWPILLLPHLVQAAPFVVDAANLAKNDRYLLASVQAIANQEGPNLFIRARPTDGSWLAAFEKIFAMKFAPIELDAARERFAKDAPQVIYDSSRPWTISIATTLAGLNRALLTDRDLGTKIIFDCREKWRDKIEAYDWAIRELLPKCDRHRFAYLDESLTPLRDFAMVNHLFTINLDPLNDDREVKLLDEVLDKFPPTSCVFGWASGSFARPEKNQTDVTIEWALVAHLSRKSMLLVPSDFSDNLSFEARLPSDNRPLSQTRHDRNLPCLPGQKYVLMVVSDGDNLQFDANHMRELWTDADRPKVPLAWTISPQWMNVAPAISARYYREAEERGGWDEFVAGPSGAAYVNPGSMPAEHLERFLKETDRLCALADIRSVTILDNADRPAADVMKFLDAYAQTKLQGAWLAGMPKYVGARKNLAYVSERIRLGNDGLGVAKRVREMNAVDDPFIFVYIFAWDMNGRAVRDFAGNLGAGCTLVSPGEMADLIRKSQH